MSWVRYGDEFVKDRRWDGVPYEARWYFLEFLAECSRGERFDCALPMTLALRCTDVPDPTAAIAALTAAGLLEVTGDEVVAPDAERRHMLPPAKRDQRRKADQRRWTAEHRRRRCEAGEHDRHCPPDCPARGQDSGEALPRDGTGQATTATTEEPVEARQLAPRPLLCSVCSTPLPAARYVDGRLSCRDCQDTSTERHTAMSTDLDRRREPVDRPPESDELAARRAAEEAERARQLEALERLTEDEPPAVEEAR